MARLACCAPGRSGGNWRQVATNAEAVRSSFEDSLSVAPLEDCQDSSLRPAFLAARQRGRRLESCRISTEST